MKSLGKHLILELYDCDPEVINDLAAVEKILTEAVNISQATIIRPYFHKFNPHGISGVIVIAESHFTIHTWPEYGYCAIDIFTCGEQIDPAKPLDFIKEKLKAKQTSVMEIKRGVLNLPDEELKHKP
ncbi:MAG TPA: S-adenosylmethionine decarboxylase proenzyme [Deltaproteobacteria bacterium]|nr:S-adenosylmethionine decarboxylase proenzyme [Deltaproteobacteria bacterium]